MSDLASVLSGTQAGVETAQRVLSTVEQGLETAERLEDVAKRTRPVLRAASIVIVGCLVALGIGLVVRRLRRGDDELETPQGEAAEGGPDAGAAGRRSSG